MKIHILSMILILLLTLTTTYRLFQPGLHSMQDDMHVFRLQQFDLCLKDGQIPCRFIRDGGLGYGYPLFNYYSPFPYILGSFFHFLGFSYISSLKIIFILSQLIAGIGIYLLAFYYFGHFALISLPLYLLAPYRALDIYVRGALAETLALSLAPLVAYFILKYLDFKNLKYFVFSVLLLTALILSHNLFALIFLPLIFLFAIISRPQLKNISTILPIYLISVGLSSFFVIPALFEKNLVTINTMTQGYFNYINHFATINQLFFDRSWGYGASLWGPIDDMSFQIGFIQWLVPLISIIIVIQRFIKTKKIEILPLSLIILFLFSIFLTHNRSTPLWQLFSFMSYFQFPWRFIGLAILCSAFLAPYLFLKQPKIRFIFLFIITTSISYILNFNYFREDIWYSNITDIQKLTGAEFNSQSAAGLKDYWPIGTQSFPSEFAPTNPSFSQKNNQILSYYKTSNRLVTSVYVAQNDNITLPLVYFPNWQLSIDGQAASFEVEPVLGQITVPLTPGEHHLELHLRNTPIRSLANITSLISLAIFFAYSVKLCRNYDKA